MATLEASVTWLNMDSPKNTRPMEPRKARRPGHHRDRALRWTWRAQAVQLQCRPKACRGRSRCPGHRRAAAAHSRIYDPGKVLIHRPAQNRPGAVFCAGSGRYAIHREQHGARVGCPPQYRLGLLVPGENAAAVGRKQSFSRQLPAYGQEAVGVVQCLAEGGGSRSAHRI